MDIHWKQKHTGDMQVRQNNGITYLSYPRLEQESAIVHGFSTRLGGVSEGYLGSMNLSFSRGDNPENVLENYRRISKAIGFPVESIVTSDQTHTTNVRRVGKKDCGCGVLTPRTFHDIDGLITNEPGVTLATFYADCVPLYFYDPTHNDLGTFTLHLSHLFQTFFINVETISPNRNDIHTVGNQRQIGVFARSFSTPCVEPAEHHRMLGFFVLP